MLETHQAVMAGEEAHLLHGEQVLVNGAVGVSEDRSKLVLGRSNLVVLGLRGDSERPKLVVELLHEVVDGGTDSAEVVLLELLALAGAVTEQGASGELEVHALFIHLFGDQEILLLGADGRGDAGRLFAKEGKHAVGLLVDCFHGAQQRRFLVERLAGVAAKRGGDAQDLVLDECIGGGVPSGVAAGLKRCAQAAVGEA